jgi:rhodanese-related sulfurtransferase
MTARPIAATDLSKLIDAGEALVVDVREPAEFAGAHIPGALSVPLGKLAGLDLTALGGRAVVLVCATGRRSSMACDQLASRVPDGVHTLTGGLAAWREAGGTVAGSGRNVLPLDRQVLIGAGSVVLTGLALGTLVHPAFLLISAFAGTGLVVAGTTGFCGMALILARAPWNQRPRMA